MGQVAGVGRVVCPQPFQRAAVQSAACDSCLVEPARRIQGDGFRTALPAAFNAMGLPVVKNVPLALNLNQTAMGVSEGSLGFQISFKANIFSSIMLGIRPSAG